MSTSALPDCNGLHHPTGPTTTVLPHSCKPNVPQPSPDGRPLDLVRWVAVSTSAGEPAPRSGPGMYLSTRGRGGRGGGGGGELQHPDTQNLGKTRYSELHPAPRSGPHTQSTCLMHPNSRSCCGAESALIRGTFAAGRLLCCCLGRLPKLSSGTWFGSCICLRSLRLLLYLHRQGWGVGFQFRSGPQHPHSEPGGPRSQGDFEFGGLFEEAFLKSPVSSEQYEFLSFFVG